MCPCKDCLDRHPLCHSTCPGYLAWKDSLAKNKGNDSYIQYVKDKHIKYLRDQKRKGHL